MGEGSEEEGEDVNFESPADQREVPLPVLVEPRDVSGRDGEGDFEEEGGGGRG